MARSIFTVTHPDGTTSTRTSQRATYTHAVVLARPRAGRVTAAQQAVDTVREQTATLEEDLTNGKRTETSKPWVYGGEYVTIHLGSTFATSYITPRDERPTDEQVRDAVKAHIENRRRSLAEHEAFLTAQEEGPEVEYTVMRWSSRADLANKALAEFQRNAARYGGTLTVVPVD